MSKKLTDEQLDNFYRGHLLSSEMEPPKEVWATISKDVARNNFLAFGWKNFNIYQVIFLGALLLCILYFLFVSKTTPDQSYPTGKKDQPTSQNATVVDTISKVASPETKTSKITSNKTVPSVRKKSAITSTTVQTKETVIQDSLPTEQKETPVELPAVTTTVAQPEEKPKPKKIITIIKRDTVTINDTLSVRRKRKSK